MPSYPFSEIMVGDKFIFEGEGDGSPIKLKTGPDTCRLTGQTYVGSGKIPEPTSETSVDFKVDPVTSVIRLLDLCEMIMQIQHEIWEASLEEDESYSEVLDRIIENTSEYEDQETDLVRRVAIMIRNAREEGYDGFRLQYPEPEP